MVGADDASHLNVAVANDRRSRQLSLLIWIAYGCVLISFIGVPAVRRTQEARVLESAREMLGAGLHGWLIPHLNGQVRLQKPPLAYWLAAGGFEAFGISEWSGRLFAAVTVWLTVGLAYLIADRLFDWTIACVSAAALGGSYLFCRFTLLAETDGVMALGLIAAIYCIIRAREGQRTANWFNLSAIATGLAFMAKASGAFSLLFLIAIALADRDLRLLWRWMRSGAPLTLVLIASPWWLYALHSPEGKIIGKELHDVTAGEDHPNSFLVYFPQLFRDVAPYTLILPIALAGAVSIGRKHRGVITCGIWLLVMFVPMCLIGNKQDHYLLPVMPPLMILVGWMIGRSLTERDGWQRLTLACLIFTGIGSAIVPLAVILVPHQIHRPWLTLDTTLAITLGMSWIMVALIGWSRGWRAVVAGILTSWLIAMPILMLLWVPRFYRSDSRSIAIELKQQFGNGPYLFYSDIVYLPLIFTIGQPIDAVDSHEDLQRRLTDQPNTIVLSRVDGNPLMNDPLLQPVMSFGVKDQHLDVYQVRR